jgi:hypothetical protein
MKNIFKRAIPICLAFLFLISCTHTSSKNKKLKTKRIQLTEQELGKSGYYISLPNDYSIKVTDGPDFSVYYFSPSDTTLKGKLTGGLYFGNNPGDFEAVSDSCKTEILKGKILDNIKEWTVYNCLEDYIIQTIADNKNGEEWNQKVHAFGHTKSKNELKIILDIYSTLRKK